jgi:hypothetical protein
VEVLHCLILLFEGSDSIVGWCTRSCETGAIQARRS